MSASERRMGTSALRRVGTADAELAVREAAGVDRLLHANVLTVIPILFESAAARARTAGIHHDSIEEILGVALGLEDGRGETM